MKSFFQIMEAAPEAPPMPPIPSGSGLGMPGGGLPPMPPSSPMGGGMGGMSGGLGGGMGGGIGGGLGGPPPGGDSNQQQPIPVKVIDARDVWKILKTAVEGMEKTPLDINKKTEPKKTSLIG